MTLSDKRQVVKDEGSYNIKVMFLEKDVKEFIKRLKESAFLIRKINETNGIKSGVSEKLTKQVTEIVDGCMFEMCERINELAGKELSK